MAVSGIGKAEIDFTNRWPLPGRYIVRIIATDYKADLTVQDVPFLVYKIGDDNRTAECCKYSAEMPVWHARTGLHHKKWTASPPQYQVLHDYGIVAKVSEQRRLFQVRSTARRLSASRAPTATPSLRSARRRRSRRRRRRWRRR